MEASRFVKCPHLGNSTGWPLYEKSSSYVHHARQRVGWFGSLQRTCYWGSCRDPPCIWRFPLSQKVLEFSFLMLRGMQTSHCVLTFSVPVLELRVLKYTVNFLWSVLKSAWLCSSPPSRENWLASLHFGYFVQFSCGAGLPGLWYNKLYGHGSGYRHTQNESWLTISPYSTPPPPQVMGASWPGG